MRQDHRTMVKIICSNREKACRIKHGPWEMISTDSYKLLLLLLWLWQLEELDTYLTLIFDFEKKDLDAIDSLTVWENNSISSI